jgi:hypothetical protein
MIKHALIIMKVFIMNVIPDEPASIAQAKQRYRYESLEALKKEVKFHQKLLFFQSYDF